VAYFNMNPSIRLNVLTNPLPQKSEQLHSVSR